MPINIQREPIYYTAGFPGLDVEQAPLYLQALAFDRENNEHLAKLISRVNQQLSESYSQYHMPAVPIAQLPRRILLINSPEDQSPLAYETRRIWEAYIYKQGWECFTRIINTRKDLLHELGINPGHTLIFSQCGQPEVYDVSLCRKLMAQGVVLVPGQATAPGGIGDKGDNRELDKDRCLVAHYRLGREGIVLESIYARKPPEPTCLLAGKPLMLEAIGSKTNLQAGLVNGAKELIRLIEQSSTAERYRLPWRLQVELDPKTGLATGVDGDRARGLCLATCWSDFVSHSLEWLRGGVGYYNWRRITTEGLWRRKISFG